MSPARTLSRVFPAMILCISPIYAADNGPSAYAVAVFLAVLAVAFSK